MPYADNRGVRIYYETEGQGPPLVLAHGMGYGGDLNAWRQTGYTEALREDFQLVLFDFRGRGRSDAPNDEPHPDSRSDDDIAAVLDSLGIERAHYMGYSMGAAAGFRQAVSHPERFLSFILGGMTPGPWPEEMVRASEISAGLDKLRRVDPPEYFAQLERLLGRPLTDGQKEELLTQISDVTAETPPPRSIRAELSAEELAGITVPCLLYCGDLDPFHAGAQESVGHMPRAAFISMHGLNHITAFARSDVVVPLVHQFLTLISGESG